MHTDLTVLKGLSFPSQVAFIWTRGLPFALALLQNSQLELDLQHELNDTLRSVSGFSTNALSPEQLKEVFSPNCPEELRTHPLSQLHLAYRALSLLKPSFQALVDYPTAHVSAWRFGEILSRRTLGAQGLVHSRPKVCFFCLFFFHVVAARWFRGVYFPLIPLSVRGPLVPLPSLLGRRQKKYAAHEELCTFDDMMSLHMAPPVQPYFLLAALHLAQVRLGKTEEAEDTFELIRRAVSQHLALFPHDRDAQETLVFAELTDAESLLGAGLNDRRRRKAEAVFRKYANASDPAESGLFFFLLVAIWGSCLDAWVIPLISLLSVCSLQPQQPSLNSLSNLSRT